MGRMERLQGVQLTKFEDVYERTCLDGLSQGEAPEAVPHGGLSFIRTFAGSGSTPARSDPNGIPVYS